MVAAIPAPGTDMSDPAPGLFSRRSGPDPRRYPSPMVALFLLLVFVVGPIIELYVFVRVAEWIGFLPALALAVGQAALGLWLIRRQGLGLVRRLQAAARDQVSPARTLVDSTLMLLAGFLLFLPGFVTGAIGLILLLPPVRALLARGMIRRWSFLARLPGTNGTTRWRRYSQGRIIDVEYIGDVTPPPSTDTSGELGPGHD